VDLTYKLGRAESEKMREGAQIHDEIFRMKKATIQQIIQRIHSGLPFAVRIPLIAKVESLFIIGVPDQIGFFGRKPFFVVELKTFGRKYYRLFPDHAVQAEIYGLLLDQMGFDCSRLRLFVVYVKRVASPSYHEALSSILFSVSLLPEFLELQETKYLRKDLLNAIDKKTLRIFGLSNSAVRGIKKHISAGDLSVFCLPYNKEKALENIRWAKDFWLGRREPKPTRKPAKCKVCEYSTQCELRASALKQTQLHLAFPKRN
jgi:CRISPR/Cas system-associated exonuclease Cas4 (RecB family)